MFRNTTLKIEDNKMNVYHIDEVIFLPNHKYSFIYNDKYHIGFFKNIVKKEDSNIYEFYNFSIDININKSKYIFNLQHYKLSPNIETLLMCDKFSDSDSDGFESDISPNYKKILKEQIKDEFDDYVKVELCDIVE